MRKRRNNIGVWAFLPLLFLSAFALAACGGEDYSDYAGKYSMLSFQSAATLQYSDFVYSEIVLRSDGTYEYSYRLTDTAAERVKETGIEKEFAEQGKYRIGASKDTITFEGSVFKGGHALRPLRFEIKDMFSLEGAVSLFGITEAAAQEIA